MEQQKHDLRFAILIDGDNASYQYLSAIVEEVAKYGIPTVKRIYSDWTKPNNEGWKSTLLDNAITPIQQFAYTTGKNATDSAMIIDAMDLLYTGNVEGFCIVSSDSDFTKLAVRLREEGKLVIGMGEQKTPTPFVKACDRFIYLNIIQPEPSKVKRSRISSKDREILLTLINNTINDLADDSGYASLADVGNLISKKRVDFDPRNYGYYKLSSLVKSLNAYEIDERPTGNPGIKHIYIKNKKEER